MSLTEAVVLAIVQGLTEFLPISSSGHLVLVEKLLGPSDTDPVGFIVLLHLASALAVVCFARKEIASLPTTAGRPLLILLIVGTIPAAVLGVALNDWIESLFAPNTAVVGGGLLFTAAILWVADRSGGGSAEYATFGPVRASGVGLAQAVAMVPGVSRSGSTLCAGMLLGFGREQAVRFSFLLSVPIIMGAGAKKILDGDSARSMVSFEAVVGFFVCFLVSLAALQILIRVVRNKKLSYFSIYCAALGAAGILWHWVGG